MKYLACFWGLYTKLIIVYSRDGHRPELQPKPGQTLAGSGSQAKTCEPLLLGSPPQQNMTMHVVWGLCLFQATSDNTPDMPTLPRSNMSGSLMCLHHFLVIRAQQEWHPALPRSRISEWGGGGGATRLPDFQVTLGVPRTLPAATGKSHKQILFGQGFGLRN